MGIKKTTHTRTQHGLMIIKKKKKAIVLPYYSLSFPLFSLTLNLRMIDILSENSKRRDVCFPPSFLLCLSITGFGRECKKKKKK
ncbi:uncharacterized protein BYT42DRAFT_584696, partial [Radiomyces spectabilis]|uniref:uncharacterized protein n=1 Tax=Radiomyces spectabilis TaxID=64574 RepID=UPI00222020AF